MRTIMFHSRALHGALAIVFTGLLLAGCGLAGGHGSLAAGAKYQSEGKYRAAYIEAKKVLRNKQNNGEAWLMLGKASLMLGKPEEALSDLDKARENGISMEHWAVPMGRALRVTHQYKKLLKELPANQSYPPTVKTPVVVLRGDAWRGLGQLEKAKKAYQAALQLDQGNPRALVGLAKLATASHDPAAAHKYVQQALAAAPDSPVAWAGKADLAFSNGNLAGAESAYQKVLGLKQRDWLPQDRFMARLKLTSVQIRSKQFDKALANIETLEKLSPQQPQPHYLHALVLYRQGQMDDAVAQLQKVLKVSPENGPAQLLMGAVNYAKGNDGQTEMYLSNVLGMDPNNVAARKLLALTYYRGGRSAQALDMLRPLAPAQVSNAALLAQLQRAVAHGGGVPHSADSVAGASTTPPTMVSMANAAGGKHDDDQFADVNRALAKGHAGSAIGMLKSMPKGDAATQAHRTTLLVMAYVSDQRIDMAIKTAAANAHAHPHDSAAQLLYGTALVADHQYDKARAQYEKAHRLDAGNVAALLNLGSLDVHEHHYKDAKNHFKAALQKQPHSAQALAALGQLAMVQHDRAGAIQWFKQAMNAAPTSTDAYLKLIVLYSRSGRFDQAASVAKKLASAAPGNPAALNAYGAAELNASHPDKALKPLQQAVKLAPNEALYRVNLARTQIILKNTKAARTNLEKVVKIDPARVSAVRLLAEIKLREHDLPGALALAQTLQNQPSTAAAGLTLEGDLYMVDKSWRKAATAYQRGLNAHYSRPLVIKQFLALRAGGASTPDKGLHTWLAKHGKDDSIRMLLAQYYMGSSQHALAADQYAQVLKTYPSNLVALNNLAWLYVEQHNPKGLALAQRAYKLSSDSPSIADTYGWALIEANRSRDALPLLEKAAKAAPKVPTIRYHLAVAQSLNGDDAGARATLATLRKTHASYPEQPAAEKLYLKLASATGGSAHK